MNRPNDGDESYGKEVLTRRETRSLFRGTNFNGYIRLIYRFIILRRSQFIILQQFPIKHTTKKLSQRLKVETTMLEPIKSIFISNGFDHMMLIAMASGVFSSVMGTYISYHIDGSTGGCIVVLQTLLFLVAMVFAPKHGLLVRAKNSRIMSE